MATAAPEETIVVHDVVPAAAASLVSLGAVVASSVSELGELVDVACVVVRDDADVRRVASELAGYDVAVAVHSTVAPDTPASLPGALLVDAPVSGGVGAAADGALAVMAGGSDAAYAACAPVLHRLASLVLHVGPLGAGTRMKLARNLVQYVSFCATAEARRLVLAERARPGRPRGDHAPQ